MKRSCIFHTVRIIKYYSDDKINQRKWATRYTQDRGIMNPEF